MLIPRRVSVSIIQSNWYTVYCTYIAVYLYQLFRYRKIHPSCMWFFKKLNKSWRKSSGKEKIAPSSSGNTFCQGRATPYIGNGHSTLRNPLTGKKVSTIGFMIIPYGKPMGIYSSSHNLGSWKWVPPRLVSFPKGSCSTSMTMRGRVEPSTL